jgi:helix-turn-helix protein
LEAPDCVEADTGRLAPEVAATLGAKLQDALDHPVRREVLRRLISDHGSCTALRLAADGPALSLSRVNYHLQVLVRSGVATRCEPTLSLEGIAFYRSTLGDQPRAQAVLDATEDWDRSQVRAAAGDAAASTRRGWTS